MHYISFLGGAPTSKCSFFRSSIHPSVRPSIRPCVPTLKTVRMSTFQAYYHLDLKSKVVSLNGKTLEIVSDLNPISHGGHLDQHFPGLV